MNAIRATYVLTEKRLPQIAVEMIGEYLICKEMIRIPMIIEDYKDDGWMRQFWAYTQTTHEISIKDSFYIPEGFIGQIKLVETIEVTDSHENEYAYETKPMSKHLELLPFEIDVGKNVVLRVKVQKISTDNFGVRFYSDSTFAYLEIKQL